MVTAASDGVLRPRLLIVDGCLFILYILLNKSEPAVCADVKLQRERLKIFSLSAWESFVQVFFLFV